MSDCEHTDVLKNVHYYCRECGYTVGGEQVVVVPKDELRALVEKWRQTAKSHGINPGDTEDIATERAYDNCAGELEELMKND